MPRKRAPNANRTDLMQSGQAPAAPTGMPYGEHQASIESQQAMPVADLAGQDPILPAEEAARAMPYQPSSLAAPSTMPDEPVTAGLPLGPGPGPEALGRVRTGRVTSMLRRIAAVSGQPGLQALADEAEAQGI